MAMYLCTNPRCPNKRHRSPECPNLPKTYVYTTDGGTSTQINPPKKKEDPYTPAVREARDNLIALEPNLKTTSVEKIVTVTAANAHRIYDSMEQDLGVVADSATREAMFELAAAYFGNDYDDYYNATTERTPMAQPWPEGEHNPATRKAYETLSVAEPLLADKSIEEIAEDTKNNAHRIYDYMNENGILEDSWTRESMFDVAAEYYGTSYEWFYQAWMQGVPIKNLPTRR